MIDESYLKDLNSEEVMFAAKFLEDIFLHKKTNISITNPSEIQIVFKVLRSIGPVNTKNVILSFLDRSTKLKISNFMDEYELLPLFIYHGDTTFLSTVFKNLKTDLQIKILRSIYQKEPEKYKILKGISSKDIKCIGGIFIQKKESTPVLIQNEKQHLLNMIQNPELSFEDTAFAGRKLLSEYDIEDVKNIIFDIVSEFIALKIKISNQESFMISLKFLYLLEPCVNLFPDLKNRIIDITDKIIISLKSLPNGMWIVKILNQLPVYMINYILAELFSYEKISSFEKRNLYCKLLKEVKSNLDQEKTSNLYFAFSQF
ncbi:MAG: hypothetical protein GY730_08480 [bacterium]|nr:hypothetical protein [bacterium]